MIKDIYRQRAREIRFFWKITVTIILTLLLIVISRSGLIFLVQQVFILLGTPSSIAFENAQIFVAESPEGQAIASSLDVLLILALIFVSVTRIERREFHLADIGLGMHRNTLPLVALGLAIGCSLFLGAVVFGVLLDTQELPMFPNIVRWPLLNTLFTSIIFYFLNGFWQEIVFRGYLQTRAVEEYGRLFGILTVTVVFVILHGLVQTITPMGVISGLLLFSFIGLLYEKTKSLYLVSVIHAGLNFLPILFNILWQGLETVITYCIALMLLILVIHRAEQKPTSFR